MSAWPSHDECDGHALQMHECRAGVPSIVETNLRHVEVADGRLPQRAQGRRVVWLAGLIADDITPIRIGLAERKFLDGLANSRRREFS